MARVEGFPRPSFLGARLKNSHEEIHVNCIYVCTYTFIYRRKHLNVGKYTKRGSYGLCRYDRG